MTVLSRSEAVQDIAGLRILDVTQRFGGLLALNRVTICIRPLRIHAIIGPNGAGKTTLFNIITGMLKPNEGTVLFKGSDITGQRPDVVCRLGIVRTFQNVRVFRKMTVAENVQVGGHKMADVGYVRPFLRNPLRPLVAEQHSCRRAKALIEFFGLQEVAARPAGQLPLADQRKVEMARALCSDPDVVLLDEPTAGMNTAEKEEMRGLILRVAEMGKTVILVEHDMRLVMSLADIVSVLNFGKLIAEGAPEEVQADPQVIDAYLGAQEL